MSDAPASPIVLNRLHLLYHLSQMEEPTTPKLAEAIGCNQRKIYRLLKLAEAEFGVKYVFMRTTLARKGSPVIRVDDWGIINREALTHASFLST